LRYRPGFSHASQSLPPFLSLWDREESIGSPSHRQVLADLPPKPEAATTTVNKSKEILAQFFIIKFPLPLNHRFLARSSKFLAPASKVLCHIKAFAPNPAFCFQFFDARHPPPSGIRPLTQPDLAQGTSFEKSVPSLSPSAPNWPLRYLRYLLL
jgi:hypothetical protein